MAKVEGQVFNICQEREATERVFPSGPGAGTVVTAARLPGPPVSSNVWSQKPEIPGKKNLNSVCLAEFWKQNTQVSSGQAHSPVQLLGQQTPRQPLMEPLGEPCGEPRRVIATICRVVCCESDIWSLENLTKLFWKWHINQTNYWLDCSNVEILIRACSLQ